MPCDHSISQNLSFSTHLIFNNISWTAQKGAVTIDLYIQKLLDKHQIDQICPSTSIGERNVIVQLLLGQLVRFQYEPVTYFVLFSYVAFVILVAPTIFETYLTIHRDGLTREHVSPPSYVADKTCVTHIEMLDGTFLPAVEFLPILLFCNVFL